MPLIGCVIVYILVEHCTTLHYNTSWLFRVA